MGSSSSKIVEDPIKNIKASVEEEFLRRMMIQREVQMAINVARARDTLHVFGSLWLTFTAGVSVAHLMKKPVPPVAGVPIVIGAIFLGNIADMAYGNKLMRLRVLFQLLAVLLLGAIMLFSTN